MLVPSDRYADGVEAIFFEESHQLGLGDGLSPSGLVLVAGLVVADPQAVAVERIAKVPTQTHVLDSAGGTLLDIGGIEFDLVTGDDKRLIESIRPPTVGRHG